MVFNNKDRFICHSEDIRFAQKMHDMEADYNFWGRRIKGTEEDIYKIKLNAKDWNAILRYREESVRDADYDFLIKELEDE